jgi:ABC-type transporter Mla subunit MlaD
LFRKIILALIVATGIAVLGLFAIRKHAYSQQVIKTCLFDARGLRSGAGVRIAGVDVGIVRSVRANTQNKDCPAEIEMNIATAYELKIPKDSIVEIQSGGLLGPPLISIDISQASGMVIENYGYLRSKPSVPEASVDDRLKALYLMLKLGEASKENKEVPKANAPSPSGRPQRQKRP